MFRRRRTTRQLRLFSCKAEPYSKKHSVPIVCASFQSRTGPPRNISHPYDQLGCTPCRIWSGDLSSRSALSFDYVANTAYPRCPPAIHRQNQSSLGGGPAPPLRRGYWYLVAVAPGSRGFWPVSWQMGHRTLKLRKRVLVKHSVQNVWPQCTKMRGMRAPTLYCSPQKWQ